MLVRVYTCQNAKLLEITCHSSYGIHQFQNQDASVEIYTLVESLAKSSQACGKLNIGDWIRSVNGTPIQLPMDVGRFVDNYSYLPYWKISVRV